MLPMRMINGRSLGFVVLALFLSGCSLMAGPQRPVLPTPIPTAPPLAQVLTLTGEVVVDPVSDVVPTVDPSIVTLIDAVSQQQLVAYVQTLENFYTRNSFSSVDSETRGIGAARRWIFSEFERVGNGRLQVENDDFNLNFAGFFAPQRNVVATLPGSNPNGGVVIVLAHYDNRPAEVADGFSRAPGANDNASGVALLLESARVLSAYTWSQTIIFLAVAAEEQGTFGSRHFAQNAYLNNVNVLAALNYDGVGGRVGIPQYLRLFAPDLFSSPSGELARYYEFVGGMYLPTFPVVVFNAMDREGRWGDHREFINVGMPSVRLIESEEDYSLLNSTSDTWSRIDYNYLQKVVQLNVAVVANIAGAPPTPPQPIVAEMAEPGAFMLTWAIDPQAAGYAVSFRPLSSPSYPPFRFVKGLMAGNVAFTNLDPNTSYAVSLAALDANGRIGHFSREVIIGPGPQAGVP